MNKRVKRGRRENMRIKKRKEEGARKGEGRNKSVKRKEEVRKGKGW